MMTGRYPQRNGLMGLIQSPYAWRLHAGERHLSHLLADGGYHTVLFNHQHEAPPDDPLGFQDRRLVDMGSHRMRTGERVASAEQTARAFAEFIRSRPADTKPFYAQIGFFETHTPYSFGGATPHDRRGVTVPPDIVDDADAADHVAQLQGAILSLDRAVAMILNALADARLDAETLVVFTTDHGVELPRGKWELYDRSLRTALLFRGPGIDASKRRLCEVLISHVDVLPTILELIGLPVPENVDGQSFARFLDDAGTTAQRDHVAAMMHCHDRWVESRCVRTNDFKLIRNFSPSRVADVPVRLRQPELVRQRPFAELYDLRQDPHETHNLAASSDYTATRRQLDAMLANWLKEVGDPLLHGPIRTPYYESAVADFGI